MTEDGNAQEYTWPSFLLVLQYQTLCRGRYQLRAQIKPHHGATTNLIQSHGLAELEVFLDRPGKKAADESMNNVVKQKEAYRKESDWLFFVEPYWWWLTLRQAYARYRQEQVVRILLGDLVRGVQVRGDFDQLRQLGRALILAVDGLAGRLDIADAFEQGQTRIYAPGKRPKMTTKTYKAKPPRWRL